jgi:hypothetical protein
VHMLPESCIGMSSHRTSCSTVRSSTHASLQTSGSVSCLTSHPQRRKAPRDAPADGWLIAGWLAPIVAHHPRDQETYELLVYKARTAKNHDEVAADHGLTTAALKSRIHQFKERYLPRWRRRQSMIVLLLLFGVAAVLLLAWLVWRLTRPDTIEPDPARIPPRVTPSATASASDTPFDPARPTPAPVDTRERKGLPGP